MKRKLTLHRMALAVAVVLALSLTACSDFEDLFEDTDAFSENHEATERDSIAVDVDTTQMLMLVVKSEVGTVKIQPSDDGRFVVDYKMTAYANTDAEAQAELAEMSVTVTPNGDRVLVDSTQSVDEGDTRSDTVDLTIHVPATIDLNVTNSVGDITVKDLAVPGTLKIAQSVGKIVLDGVAVAAPMDIHSDVGDVRFDGSLAADQAHSISTATGEIHVALPGDASLVLDAETTVGHIDVNDFEMSSKSEEKSGAMASMQATLGDGGATLTLRASVGDISLKQS